MNSPRELQERWSQLLNEIATPVPMLRGSVCQARMRRKRADGSTRLSAPTSIYTRKVKARTVTRSLNAQNAENVQQAVENFHRFQAVVEEFKAVGEKLAQAQSSARGSSKKNSSR